jgi:probable HAF family extracellular repeat protein
VTVIGINDPGQVVANVVTASGEHAVLWQHGRMTDLGTLPGGRYSQAVGINDSGQVVGYADTGSDPFPSSHAFLWQNGRMIDLGTPPGGQG